MSDSLRDRIAAVIARNRMDRTNYELADAVIAELQLHPVETLDRRYLRYCTDWRNNPDWKADDE